MKVPFVEENLDRVSELFIKMGAAPAQAQVMAAQLLKKALQDAEAQAISPLQAVETLLKKVMLARDGLGNMRNTQPIPKTEN